MAGMLPQRLLDMFDPTPSSPASESSRSGSSRSSADRADENRPLSKSTRLVPFDNTAFLAPVPCTSSSISPFPSTVCVNPSSAPSIPPRVSEHIYLAEFVVAYLTTNSGDRGKLDDIVAGIVSALGIVPRGGPQEENVRERAAMFLGWMKPAERAVFVGQGADHERVVTGRSGPNGISSDLRWVGQPRRGKKEIVWRALTAPGDNRIFEMRTLFAGPSGWTVVSDIDDTIKISEVNNRLALLRNTFVAEPSAVPGMPELYQLLDNKLGPAWFYLSASPWQLYPFLHEFITTSVSNGTTLYPRGQMILRDMSRSAMPAYLSALTMGTREYKFDRLTKIHGWMGEPGQRVLLIGDSTQTDPEAYGDAARKWPGWVAGIWIRVVSGVNPDKEKDLNAPERFEKAFKGVDRSIWRTFQDAKELESVARGLKP